MIVMAVRQASRFGKVLTLQDAYSGEICPRDAVRFA